MALIRTLAVLAAALACAAAPAAASDFLPGLPGGAEQELDIAAADTASQRSDHFERWRGRGCPLQGCGPPPRARATTPLAFGAAVGAIAWLSRRRGPSDS
jgi:hypothetical protein